MINSHKWQHIQQKWGQRLRRGGLWLVTLIQLPPPTAGKISSWIQWVTMFNASGKVWILVLGSITRQATYMCGLVHLHGPVLLSPVFGETCHRKPDIWEVFSAPLLCSTRSIGGGNVSGILLPLTFVIKWFEGLEKQPIWLLLLRWDDAHSSLLALEVGSIMASGAIDYTL